MKRILIVEDLDWRQTSWKHVVDKYGKGEVELLQAFSIPEAERILEARPNLDLILMDACVPGHDVNTDGLVAEIRTWYAGLLVAISNDPYYNTILCKAGCDSGIQKGVVREYLQQQLEND